MNIKYYGVPHNAVTLQRFIASRGKKISNARSERLFALYKWLLEEPRQWENVGLISFRAAAPTCYSDLKASTYFSDVRLLARVKLVFPMLVEATFMEEFERTFPLRRCMGELLKYPTFAKSMREVLQNPFGSINTQRDN